MTPAARVRGMARVLLYHGPMKSVRSKAADARDADTLSYREAPAGADRAESTLSGALRASLDAIRAGGRENLRAAQAAARAPTSPLVDDSAASVRAMRAAIRADHFRRVARNPAPWTDPRPYDFERAAHCVRDCAPRAARPLSPTTVAAVAALAAACEAEERLQDVIRRARAHVYGARA
jgi:hypothetical protein